MCVVGSCAPPLRNVRILQATARENGSLMRLRVESEDEFGVAENRDVRVVRGDNDLARFAHSGQHLHTSS